MDVSTRACAVRAAIRQSCTAATTHVTVTAMTRRLVLAVSVAAVVTVQAQTPAPAEHPGLVRVLADTPESRAQWDRRLARHGRRLAP